MSENTIYERMVAILAELPAIGKNQKNMQQNFMFRGHDDVLNALNPLLAKHGVFVVPQVLERIVGQRTTSKGSVMFEVNLCVEYVFYGLAGDYVRASAWGEGTDMGDKATNKAMTMAFKNVLNQAFAISTEEMIDSDAHTPEHSVGEPKPAAGDGSTQRKPPAAAASSPPKFKAPSSVGAKASVDSLTELYKLTTELGAQAATQEAVEAREEAGTLTQDWVDRCIATAKKNLAQKKAA
jgi:ERF superfamily protein